MHKTIFLITGSTETLGYFSKQIGFALMNAGYDVFIWDMQKPTESRELFEKLEPDTIRDAVLITFNFIGLCGEGQFGENLTNVWDYYGVRKICILVDSPLYYYRQLTSDMINLSIVCIDRNHERYIKRFYPQYVDTDFSPLAGNALIEDMWLEPGMQTSNNIYVSEYSYMPIDKRPIDMSFIGNYVTIDSIMPSLVDATPDYKEFIYNIAQDLIDNPTRVLEDELLFRLKNEFPDEDDSSYMEAMFHMIFIDMYVRTHFRTNMIRVLADEGYKIHLVGQDWDKLECKRPENLIYTSQMRTSADCIRALRLSKISLNIMPWFKAGAHDRIFSSMLAGCVTVTDSSLYLDEVLVPWRDYIPFTLGDDNTLLEAVSKAYTDSEMALRIAKQGNYVAKNSHTWDAFTKHIINRFEL